MVAITYGHDYNGAMTESQPTWAELFEPFSPRGRYEFGRHSSIFLARDEPLPPAHVVQDVKERPTSVHTEFFRSGVIEDMKIIAALAPEIQRRTGRPLRISQIGCASGEETWVLAALLEKQRVEYTIDAMDINPSVLYLANKARYAKFNMHQQNKATELEIAEYFELTEDEQHLQPIAVLKRNVRFTKHDILADPLSDGPYDALLLKNMLYHYNAKARDTIMDNALSGLADDGIFAFDGSSPIVSVPDYADWGRQLEARLGLSPISTGVGSSNGIRRYIQAARFTRQSPETTLAAATYGTSLIEQVGAAVTGVAHDLPFALIGEATASLAIAHELLRTAAWDSASDGLTGAIDSVVFASEQIASVRNSLHVALDGMHDYLHDIGLGGK